MYESENKMRKSGNSLVLSKSITLSGIRKVGFDTGVLVCLADTMAIYHKQMQDIVSRNDLFFTSDFCKKEAIKKLIELENLKKENAKKKIEQVIAAHKISVLPRTEEGYLKGEEIKIIRGLHKP